MTATAKPAPDAPADAPEPSPYNEHPARPEDALPTEPTALEAPTVRPPRFAIDWAASRVTAGLVAAIARAQSDIRPVGKDSRNEQGSGGKGYNYASADDMIGECRRAFSRQGVAIVTAHYMQDPPSDEPISVDPQGNPTQWLSCTLKGETALLFTEPATREVGVLVIRWEQDAIGKRGTPPDKAQRAAETYALGFVSRGIGHMSRGATPKDEDRDQHDDEGERPRRRGAQAPAQQGTQRTTTPASSAGGASSSADKLAGLRDSVKLRYHNLGGKEWRPWLEVCTASGLKGTVRVAEADAGTLRNLHDYLAEQQLARETDQRQPEGDEPPAEREPGQEG